MTHNPLIPAILSLLKNSPAGLSEYAIHRSLADHEAFSAIDAQGSLALFKKHFLVMNALYQLQLQQWQVSRCLLHISALHIQLDTTTRPADNQRGNLAEADASAAYYLDWNNYRQTSEADVETLLDSFWQRFVRQDHRLEAIKTLELDTDASAQQIEHRYRKLAAIHHPDRGGDKETFINIRSAYEQLR